MEYGAGEVGNQYAMPEMRRNTPLISHHFRVFRSVCVRYTRVITIQSWVTQSHADGEEECPQHRCSCECRKRFTEHLNRVYIGVGSLLFAIPFAAATASRGGCPILRRFASSGQA